MSSLSSFTFFAIKENSMLDLHNVSHIYKKTITSKYTLLYKPLPSGSEMATMILSFFDLRYLPTPATVPPVPTSHHVQTFCMWGKNTSAHLHQIRMHLNDHLSASRFLDPFLHNERQNYFCSEYIYEKEQQRVEWI